MQGLSLAEDRRHVMESTPWLLPASKDLAYEGLQNDVDALLKAQHTADNWIAVFMFRCSPSNESKHPP